MKIPRISSLPRSLRTYRELIHDGVIRSSADNEKIIVNLKGYITGDIQLCIGPKDGLQNPDWLVDGDLQGVGNEALRLFRIKFESLRVLPLFLIFLLNSGGLLAYYRFIYLKSEAHSAILDSLNLNPDLQHLLILIIPALSIRFSQRLGSLILKAGIEVMYWIQKLQNHIKDRKKT